MALFEDILPKSKSFSLQSAAVCEKRFVLSSKEFKNIYNLSNLNELKNITK